MSAFGAPFAFPFGGGGDVVTIPTPDITGIVLVPVIPISGEDHLTNALTRLSQQFKDAGG